MDNLAATTTGPFDAAIRNPANADHFMVIKPVDHRVRIYVGDRLIADSTNAVRVIEFGKSVYDPAVYLPQGDLTQKLEFSTRTTHCPLKGDARYGSFSGAEVGWVYDTFDFSEALAGHVGFWAKSVRIVEGE
jgi:uncharacterized protein (DUF427 family)